MDKQFSDSRRGRILQSEMRHAADSRDVAGICTAYVRTAHRIVKEFPNMSAEEKQAHFASLKHDIERLKVQANQDCSKVLDELRRILG